MNKVSIFPVMNLPEFDTGHEIVEELIESLEKNKISLEDSDVIVITQKIISKVEGRKIDINKECIEELTSIQIVDFELAMNQLLVEALPPTVGDIYAIENDALGCPSVDWCNHLNELATWNGVDWDYSSPAEGDIAWKSPNFYWFTSSVWTLIPNITTVTSIGINSWNVIGDAHPCYFVRMEFSYDGGTTWPTIAGYFTASEFSAGVDIASVAVPTHTRAVMFNYNCPSITSKSASLP